MNKETKNVVYNYFNTVIANSWTWGRLTEEEKACFMDCVKFDKIHGTKRQKIETFCMIYGAFLDGLGFKPSGW